MCSAQRAAVCGRAGHNSLKFPEVSLQRKLNNSNGPFKVNLITFFFSIIVNVGVIDTPTTAIHTQAPNHLASFRSHSGTRMLPRHGVITLPCVVAAVQCDLQFSINKYDFHFITGFCYSKYIGRRCI